MTRLRTRPFEPGDDDALNALYNRMVSVRWLVRPRSLQLMRWLWFHAPGGPVASWLVEAEQGDGSWKMVGHHALCPVRFTLGEHEFVCAKTTNSMLVPEFRSKFLYVRFEKQCLAEAGDRFAATYSCAPGVTRTRKALGYEVSGRRICLGRGLHAPEVVSRLLGHMGNRYSCPAWGPILRAAAAISQREDRRRTLKLVELTSAESMHSPFFADFWQQSRLSAGMSARRDPADLAWRFWQRPESTYTTLVHEGEHGSRAYCIVNTTHPCSFHLEDIFLLPLRADLLDALLASLFHWCAQRGALLLAFSTATDGQPPEFLEVFARNMRPHPLERFRPVMDMPRRFSPSFKSGLRAHALRWNTTSLLLPG